MLISSSAGLLTALAVIATSVAIPAPVPQKVDVCGLGAGVYVGASKNTHNGPFNIRVIPNRAVTPSLPLGYSDNGDGSPYLRLEGTATTFNLTNNLLTTVINGKETQAKAYDGSDAIMGLPSNNIPTIKFSETQRCVGNAVVNVLAYDGHRISVTGFNQGAYIHVDSLYNFQGGGLGGTGGLGGGGGDPTIRNPALLQVVPA